MISQTLNLKCSVFMTIYSLMCISLLKYILLYCSVNCSAVNINNRKTRLVCNSLLCNYLHPEKDSTRLVAERQKNPVPRASCRGGCFNSIYNFLVLSFIILFENVFLTLCNVILFKIFLYTIKSPQPTLFESRLCTSCIYHL